MLKGILRSRDEWCCTLDIYELCGYMACSIIPFKTHFKWHPAHSPGHTAESVMTLTANFSTLLKWRSTFSQTPS